MKTTSQLPLLAGLSQSNKRLAPTERGLFADAAAAYARAAP